MADERELGIKVTGDVSDVESALNDLKTTLGDFNDTKFDVDANTENAESQIENLKSTIDQISGDTFEVTVDAEDDASSVVDAISAKLDELQGDNANIIITGEDDAASVIEQVKDELESLPTQVDIEITATDNASGPISEAESATTGLETAATGAAAVGLDVWLYKMITGAGQYEDSVMAMGTATRDSGTTAEQVMANWGNSVTDMTTQTGRGAGDARNHITLMGLSGVTARDQMVSLFADASTAAAADPLHKSLDSVDAGLYNLIRGVPPSSRSLKTLGVSMNDLEAATGKTAAEWSKDWDKMTEDQRAAVLHQVMYYKYGEKEGTLYQQSFQHSTDEVGRSFEYLLRKLGDPILDTVKGGLHSLSDIVKGLGDNFSKLPGSIQFVLSSIIGLAAGVTTVLAALKTFDKTVGKIFGTDFAGQMWRGMKLDTVTDKIKSELKKWFRVEDVDSGLNSVRQRIASFIEDVKGIFTKEKPKFEIITNEDGTTEEARMNDLKGKVSKFVSDIKGKIGELKDSNVYKLLFGDEEGSVDVNKITGAIDTIKGKIDELKGYNIYEKIFGPPGEGESKSSTAKNEVSTTVDSAKTKVDELKDSNIFKRLFGTEEVGPVIEGASEEAGKGAEKVGTSVIERIKSLNWKGLGIGLAGTLVEGLAMGIGIYFGEQDLERKRTEYDKYKRGEKANISPDEIQQMEQAEKVQGWQKQNQQGKQGDTYGFDDLYNDIIKAKNAIPLLQASLNTIKLPEGLKQTLDIFTKIICAIVGCSPGIIPSIDLLKVKINELIGVMGKIPNPFTLLQQAIDTAKQKWEELKTGIGQKVEEIKGIINIPWSMLYNGLNEAKQWVFDRWTELKTWIFDRKTDIENILKTISWSDMEQGLADAKQWIEDRLNELVNFVGTIPQKMFDFGKQIGEKLAEGIKSAQGSINDALDWIRQRTETHSPPEEGPLSQVTPEGWSSYGSTLGSAMADGVKNALSEGSEHWYYGPNGEIQISLMEQQGFDKSKDASNAGTDATRNYPDAITYGQNSGGASWEDSLMSDLQSQLGGSSAGLNDLTQSAGGASAALADVTTNSAHAALGGIDQLGDSSAKAALGWIEATNTVKAALGGISGESNAHPALAAVVSGTPLTGARPALGGVNINVNVSENAVQVDATDTTHKAGLGGATGKRIGKGLGQAIADEIGVSVKNQGIKITRW